MNKVLIADDSAFMRRIIKRVFEKAGFTVVGEAGDGIACLEKYHTYRPEIVTLDVTMPRLDGIQVLRALRQIDPEVKVIMISAMGQESIVKDSIAIGAASFIVKPFKEEQLISVLNKISR